MEKRIFMKKIDLKIILSCILVLLMGSQVSAKTCESILKQIFSKTIIVSKIV